MGIASQKLFQYFGSRLAKKRLSLITTHRQHLFALTRLLVEAIDPKVMQNPKNPVLISVRGSFMGGKKIFPDAARDTLLGTNCSFEGNYDYDEIWRGVKDGHGLEVDFINADWGCGYHKDFGGRRNKDKIIENFLRERKHGGITFVHNHDKFAENKAGIDICLEGLAYAPITYRLKYKFRAADEALRNEFNRLATGNNGKWVRYLEITVRDKRLLSSARFMAVLESLSLDKTAANAAPVYGVNVPRKAVSAAMAAPRP